MTVASADGITFEQAAAILGCSTSQVLRYAVEGRLAGGDEPHRRWEHRWISRAATEELAREVYDWRKRQGDDSYWVTGKRAADILGVNVARLGQLVAKGFVPFVVHVDGTRLYRREQLEVVANARDARWH